MLDGWIEAKNVVEPADLEEDSKRSITMEFTYISNF